MNEQKAIINFSKLSYKIARIIDFRACSSSFPKFRTMLMNSVVDQHQLDMKFLFLHRLSLARFQGK